MSSAAQVLQTVTSRLQAAIGLDPASLDPQRLQWILRARSKDLRFPDLSAYAGHLAKNCDELNVLIDEVVVGETRFFRDPVVFDHVRQAMERMAGNTKGPLRLLSAPCSSGEEAYSLSALMQLVGVSSSRYVVDAFDISLSALDTARRGIYPRGAFERVEPALQRVCAELKQGQWVVHPVVRASVNFQRRNLAEAGSLAECERYHLILCRNLFIYLAPAARAALAESLSAALLPGGRLFLGTADRVSEVGNLFSPIRPASSFSYSHRISTEAGDSLSADPGLRARKPLAAQKAVRISLPAKKDASQPPSSDVLGLGASPVRKSPARKLLERATELYTRGEFAQAERRCRQALYMEPDLLPALELLQVLWSGHTNLRQRGALRERVQRHRVAAVPAEVSAGIPNPEEAE
jgi:chemotaxis protein methyltransferase WspC